MKVIIVVLSVLFVHCAIAQQFPNGSFGDRLSLTFGRFASLPISRQEARENDWAPVNASASCNQDLGGYAWTKGGGEPTKRAPEVLVFNEAGELGGFGVKLYGAASAVLGERGFWSDRFGVNNMLAIRTRAKKASCDASVGGGPVLGDRLTLLDFSDEGFEIPTTLERALRQEWSRGQCLPRMGTHTYYDVLSPGNKTYSADSMLPILPMYRPQDGSISAVLINTPNRERTFVAGGVWEGPLKVEQFCYNMCQSDQPACAEGLSQQSTGWNTLHWMFSDIALNNCTGAICHLGQ
jgi:hypothetical protein